MKLPLLLVALVVLTAALSVRVADLHDEPAAGSLQEAVQQAADRAAAVGGTIDYDDAVRVGPALVPVRVAVRTARGGATDGRTHSTVRATGPGGVPVVATATRAG